MEALYVLVPLGVVVALVIGAAFRAAAAGGQFEDLDESARLVIEDDEPA